MNAPCWPFQTAPLLTTPRAPEPLPNTFSPELPSTSPGTHGPTLLPLALTHHHRTSVKKQEGDGGAPRSKQKYQKYRLLRARQTLLAAAWTLTQVSVRTCQHLKWRTNMETKTFWFLPATPLPIHRCSAHVTGDGVRPKRLEPHLGQVARGSLGAHYNQGRRIHGGWPCAARKQASSGRRSTPWFDGFRALLLQVDSPRLAPRYSCSSHPAASEGHLRGSGSSQKEACGRHPRPAKWESRGTRRGVWVERATTPAVC